MKAHQIVAFVDILASSGLGSPPDYHPVTKNEAALRTFLTSLSETEVDFVLKLLPHYKIHHNYRLSIFHILSDIKSNYNSNICFTPVIDANAPQKIKSGTHIFYEFKALAETYFTDEFHFIDVINSSTKLDHNHELFAVDDFVGSGTQFLDMVDLVNKNTPNVKISGLCVPFIMQAGYDAAIARKLRVFCCEIRQKAIDVLLRNAGENVNELYAINDAIEERMNVRAVFARGYDQSEALISLKKTPDNTFPIFWDRGDDKKWLAPFPR